MLSSMMHPAWTQRLRSWTSAVLLLAATACSGGSAPSGNEPPLGSGAGGVVGASGAPVARAGTGGEASSGATSGSSGGGGRAGESTAGTGGVASPGGTSSGNETGGASVAGGGAAGSEAGGGGLAGASGGEGGAGGASYPVSDGKPTVYLAGDSTVQTYSASQAPQQGWGQRIQEFFTADVSFVNKAIGGRSSKSFIDEGRLDEITKLLKKGDYLFCQWGINDRYKSDPARYTDPATTFRDYLKQYITAARSKNAIAVLVTPTPRLDYVNGMFMNDFQGYCDAIEAVGAETRTPVIDLQTKALAYYTSVGYEVVERDLALDVLHFKEKGAYQMARLVAEGTGELGLPISGFVKK